MRRVFAAGLRSQRILAEIAVAHLVGAGEAEAYFGRTPCNFRRRGGAPVKAVA
ncbi:hypothetical protein [Sphingomonas sp.]|uniref:hypothetical protein n=1 Tax=Sphingomonas sp. TaxID=28214 RepID=UPI001B1B0CA0|nr:hypothetical protein [Sphingomonas sp.]MBO9712275.1 hypothetical protein [Sphingomonas sp.]